MSDTLIELDFGPDFDRLSPSAARSLVAALSRWLEQLPPPVPADVPPSLPVREVIVILEV